jgi:hypothetical protein
MSIRSLLHGVSAAACLTLPAILWPAAAYAAELVMFTRDGCPWCARFEREVGPIYPKTIEGRLAPLRRVEVLAGGAVMAGLNEPVVAAPTFVLLDEGREIGRITGYPGDDAFWGLLGKMLAAIGSPQVQKSGTAAMVTTK